MTPVDRAADVGPSGYLQARWRAITPGGFAALGLPTLRGRVFDAGDRWDGPPIVVITRTLAERLWPGQDAIGRELFRGGVDGEPLTVIGVVGDFEDVLLDVPGSDPRAFVVAAAVLLVVGLAAAWLPARQAARIAPMEALRQE